MNKLEDIRGINAQGTGLGLLIANTIVKKLNENDIGVSIQSTIDVGSTFSFMLHNANQTKVPDKIEEQDSPISENIEKTRKKSVHRFRNPKLMKFRSEQLVKSKSEVSSLQSVNSTVLTVDDNPFNQLALKNMIEAQGLHVVAAFDGEEAVSKVLEDPKKFKLILMDAEMPVMNGYEATKTLKDKMIEKEIPDIPIYMVSANIFEVEKERFENSKADGYFTKPLKKADFQQICELWNI